MELSIKYRIKHLGKIIIGIVSALLFGVTLLLVVEYRFFHDQAQKMLELKEEYRTYTLAVKKILNEYNAMKEQAEEVDKALQLSQLKEGSDDSKESFVVVNRELNYLKQSTINYLRKENLEFALRQIDLNDFLDYTDQVMAAKKGTKQNCKLVRKKKRTKISRRFSQQKLFSGPDRESPTDIHFIWPIDRSQFWLSSFFGPRRKPNGAWGFHYGIDMASVRGTPVKAAADGVIIEAHCHSGYGNTIVISHSNKYKTRYAHLDKMHVSVGQKVEQGQLIGKVGATGHIVKRRGRDGSHLHFEVYSFGKQINPLYFFM